MKGNFSSFRNYLDNQVETCKNRGVINFAFKKKEF